MPQPKPTWDEEQLREAIRTMARRSPLYKLLQEELTRLGHWKKRERGKAFRRGSDARRISPSKEPTTLPLARAKHRDQLASMLPDGQAEWFRRETEPEYDFDPTAESEY